VTRAKDEKITYVNEGRGQHNASAELLQDDEKNALLRHARKGGSHNGQIDSQATSHKNNKEQSNAQRDIVIALSIFATRWYLLLFPGFYAVPVQLVRRTRFS
jgi:hypothetical protein